MAKIEDLQVYIPGKPDVIERASFITAAALPMGNVVELNSSGQVASATGQDEAIGIIDNMPAYRAKNETGTVASGDTALVALFGKRFKGESGGTFAAGMYLKFAAGKLVQTATNGTTVSQFIALETASAAAQIKKYLVK